MRPQPLNNNFIEDNIKKISIWGRINEKEKEERGHLFQQRRENAIKRRERLFMDKIKQNIYYMNRWNIVREKRKDIELLEKQEERK
jgi:hypothetical protein